MRPIEAEKLCVICLNAPEPNKLANLDCCTHPFCYECIFEWATKSENSCPLCKQKFNKIVYKDESGKTKNKTVKDKKQFISGLDLETLINDESEDFCYVCLSGEDGEVLMICDMCSTKVCHTYCAGLGDVVPLEDWWCLFCTSTL